MIYIQPPSRQTPRKLSLRAGSGTPFRDQAGDLSDMVVISRLQLDLEPRDMNRKICVSRGMVNMKDITSGFRDDCSGDLQGLPGTSSSITMNLMILPFLSRPFLNIRSRRGVSTFPPLMTSTTLLPGGIERTPLSRAATGTAPAPSASDFFPLKKQQDRRSDLLLIHKNDLIHQ